MKIRHTYRITASILAMVILLTTIAATGNCAAMNMSMDMHSSGIMKNHMMSNHECCNMNMPEYKSVSNFSITGADWCQCQIAQLHPISSIAIINTSYELHFYPVVLSSVELTPVKTVERVIPDNQFRPSGQVPLFIRNLSLLN